MSGRLAIAVAILLASCSAAEARTTLDNPEWCPVELGPRKYTFTAYQPTHRLETFCEALPDLGPTIIAVEPSPELRDMWIEVRILHDVARHDLSEVTQANTEFYVAPKKYPSGVVNIEHDFKSAGKFFVVVRAVSDDNSKRYQGVHSFSVGQDYAPYMVLAYKSLVVIGVLAAGFWMWRERRQHS
jgi:hypothetical protein